MRPATTPTAASSTTSPNQVVPMDDHVVPMDDQVVPMDDQVVPMDDQVVPMDDQVARQVELEAESLAMGVSRYRTNLERRGHEDTTVGQRFLRATVPPVADGLDLFVRRAKSGGAGRRHLAVKYLERIDPTSAAFLGLRVSLQTVSEARPLLTTALNIGQCIKEHVEWMDLKGDKPKLVQAVVDRIKAAQQEHYRRAVARNAVARHGAPLDWGNDKLVKVGLVVLDHVVEHTGMFAIRHQSEGKNRTRAYLQATDEAREWLDRMHGKAELLNPVWMPMVVPPKDWSTPWDGGYLTRELPVVKTNSQPYLQEIANRDLGDVYAALNAIQRTPWRINGAILDVLRTAWQAGDVLGGLPPRDPEPLPQRPADIDTNPESLKQWKRAATEVYDRNAKLESRRLAVLRQLALGERFQDEPRLYFPHAMDWRGRMYPIPTDVTPQGDDIGKALLQFAEGKPLGEHGAYWLAVHIANLFGVDKVSNDERVQWTQSHTSELLDSAMDPLDGQRFWTTADDPWQALAACIEWAGFSMVGTEYVSHLPVAMDGSCNGLQNFSAMLRDEVGGKATNLVPQSQPADIYTEVAEVVRDTLQDIAELSDDEQRRINASKWLQAGISRKLAKRPVMTMPYGATKFGMRSQLAKTARELDLFDQDEDLFPLCNMLAGVVYESIGQVVIAARVAMDWLQEVAKLAAQEELPVRWTAPNGLPVQQEYRKTAKRTIEGFIGGRRVQLRFRSEQDPIDSKRQALGIAPNLVHSMDAAHLMGTVRLCAANGIQDFAMVHDSYGVHACDVDTLHVLIREAFVQQYSEPVLQNFRDEIEQQLSPELADQLPEVPRSGTLDLGAVRQSEYFFA